MTLFKKNYFIFIVVKPFRKLVARPAPVNEQSCAQRLKHLALVVYG